MIHGTCKHIPFPRREIDVDFFFQEEEVHGRRTRKFTTNKTNLCKNNSRNLSFSSTANTQSFKCHFSEYHYNFKNSCNFFWQCCLNCSERFRQRWWCFVVVITQTDDSAVIIVVVMTVLLLLHNLIYGFKEVFRNNWARVRLFVCTFCKISSSLNTSVCYPEGRLSFSHFLKKMNTRNAQV